MEVATATTKQVTTELSGDELTLQTLDLLIERTATLKGTVQSLVSDVRTVRKDSNRELRKLKRKNKK